MIFCKRERRSAFKLDIYDKINAEVTTRACLHQTSASTLVAQKHVVMTLPILFSLKTMVLLQNGLQPILEQLHCFQPEEYH